MALAIIPYTSKHANPKKNSSGGQTVRISAENPPKWAVIFANHFVLGVSLMLPMVARFGTGAGGGVK